MNHLMDLPKSEYKKLNGYRHSLNAKTSSSSKWLKPLNAYIPKAVDWREKGYVTDVKDQGDCGSCWAFSAIASLEGQHKRATGHLVSLSEQNLIDCSGPFGNLGCNGGEINNAFQYIDENHGIDTEKSYPYEQRQGKCRFKNGTLGSNETGYFALPSGDEEALKYAIATQGPVAVAIDAGNDSFQMYKSGVYFEPKCGNTSEDLDHGVLAVGYGSHPKFGDYWIVKNSWGEDWGDKGYILMARNKNNHCGIATRASFPIV
uniref:Cathepsin L-like n=1 Tax=Panagrolaimus davidi TaxID=227884 RepID=A0A914P6U4_9BILA